MDCKPSSGGVRAPIGKTRNTRDAGTRRSYRTLFWSPGLGDLWGTRFFAIVNSQIDHENCFEYFEQVL